MLEATNKQCAIHLCKQYSIRTILNTFTPKLEQFERKQTTALSAAIRISIDAFHRIFNSSSKPKSIETASSGPIQQSIDILFKITN